MLIRLFGKNFRSLASEFELSMMAADLPAEQGRGVTSLVGEHIDGEISVLRCAALFGHNASGKSNVLRAAHALRWLIQRSSREMQPDGIIGPYEPFRLDEQTRKSPTTLGATIFHDGAIYEYEISFTASEVLNERLSALHAPDAPLIKRSTPTSVEGSLQSRSRLVSALLDKPRPNVPAFSFLAQHGPESGPDSLHHLRGAFASSLRFRELASSARPDFDDPVAEHLSTNLEFKTWLLSKLIVPADVGITDIEPEQIELPHLLLGAPEEIQKSFAGKGPYYRPLFRHGADPSVPFDLFEESLGTRKMYNIALDWWALATRRVTIFADELSASLHPILLDHLIRAINHRNLDPDPMSQLIFATHDTGLLEARNEKHAALRRDQIYFTKKLKNGGTELYSLAEFKEKARPVHALRKRYLDNRYGAIPDIEGILM